MKDIDCPSLWHDKLKEQIPPGVFYLNDSVGEIGGVGAREERYANGVGSRLGRGIAKAGDLMSCMPPAMRAENLMCYIGHEGTYTPCHREMCASLGQNIMVETSGNVGEDGKPTKPGSSIWFMTETKDRHLVSEYWLSSLGHDIEVEGHFASIESWTKAPFKVWVVEQKVGDFILIPPLAPHQVWNRGTRTMKVAWNRTTVETLELALKEALPRARMVCRDEQYKNKAIILFTLNKYSGLLKSLERQKQAASDDATMDRLISSSKIRQLEKDFRRLFVLFVDMMLSETLSSPVPRFEYVTYDSNITCSYCRCNIFNRFLTCKNCVVPLENDEEDTYDICLDCYAMGRSCKCISKLAWVEQFPLRDLLEKYNLWRGQILRLSDAETMTAPLPLDQEKQALGKKTLAEICLEQLKLRPFKNSKKEAIEDDKDDEEEEEIEVRDDGTVRKRTKKKPEKWYRDHPRCHICCHRHVRWKTAVCSCETAFCYGSLWRGFDTMPQTIMEDPEWQCPKCRKTCSCVNCVKDPENQPYQPKGTVLGHDTRKFADPRSVESLVDFSASNMHWINKTGDNGPNGSRRMSYHADAAALERARNPALGDNYVYSSDNDDMVIDPSLAAARPSEDGDGEQVGIQQAAADALNMMSGLSALERDPQAFMEQAGIGRHASGELTYEYPDPEGSPHGILPTTENEEMETPNKKKKKGRDVTIVQSDAALSEANAKYQRVQANDRMKEARRKGHYISTQAAMRGRSLMLRLPVDPAILARLEAKYPAQLTAVEPQTSEDFINVQSDLPKNIPDRVAKSRNPHVPKKRTRDDEDKSYFANKKEEQRANFKVTGGRRPASNVQEDPIRSDSDLDAEADFEEEAASGRRQSNGMSGSRRTLPSYLARRSPVDPTELPSELVGRAPKRVKHQATASTNSPDLQLAAEMNDAMNATELAPTNQLNGSGVVSDIDGHAPHQDQQRPRAPTAPMHISLSSQSSTPSPSPTQDSAVPGGLSLPDRSARKPSKSTTENETEEESEDKSEVPEFTSKLTPQPGLRKPSEPRISANLKAKLIASGQSLDDSESDTNSEGSSSSEEVISHIPVAPSSVKRGRGRPPKATTIQRVMAQPTPPKAPPAEKRSIFSKASRGGKIKITSARAPASGSNAR